MAARPILEQDRVRALFDYDPEAGTLVWKTRPRIDFDLERDWKSWNTRFSGKPAGWRGNLGYMLVHVDGRIHLAHHAVWAYVHGNRDGDAQIDHINGRRDDNRAENLRAVTQAENHRNMKRYKSNRSGVNGVSWDKARGKWTARITHDRRVIPIGRFDCFDEAVAARKDAEKKYGFHANHGRDQ